MLLRDLFFNSRRRLRAGWRIVIYAAVTAVCGWIALSLYFAGGGLSPRGTIAGPAGELVHLVWLDFLLCGASLLGAFVMLRFIDRRPFSALGFSFHDRVAVELGQGFAAGFLMVSIIFAAEWALGWAGASWNFAGVPATAEAGAMYSATFGSAAALEEILARGYILQALIQGTGKIIAVAITSALFGLGHVINPHAGAFSVLNTILAGIWLSVAYVKTRSLWLPTGLHFAWNFSLAFIYGFPVSGLRVSQPIFHVEQGGPEWMTGGSYGPEGGALGLIVIVAGAVWVWTSRHVRASDQARALWEEAAAVPEEQ